MQIEIIKKGLKNGKTGQSLKIGDKLEVTKERGEAAIKAGNAKQVKTESKKSQQKKVEDSLEKK